LRVLVTGVAGFIGFHVARGLAARGDEVLGIDNLDPYYLPQLKQDRLARLDEEAGGRVTFRACDFADEHALSAAVEGQAIDRIVHLGAQAGVRYSIDHPRAYARANMVGHLNVLEFARERRVAHMVYASSSSVYGNAGEGALGVSRRADHPLSLYAATKRADELMSESYAHLYRVPTTGLRFFTVYGPWGRPDMAVWLFTDAILAGRPIAVFNGGAMRRDFTFIDDVVAGVIAALDRPPADDGTAKPGGSVSPHAIYNLGNSHPEPLGRVIDEIERACDRPALREMRPMQPGDVTATFADITEAARDLGYAPTTPINIGISRFVDWFRAYRG
jgi:UDP-glucuronate 4-epimerase